MIRMKAFEERFGATYIRVKYVVAESERTQPFLSIQAYALQDLLYLEVEAYACALLVPAPALA